MQIQVDNRQAMYKNETDLKSWSNQFRKPNYILCSNQPSRLILGSVTASFPSFCTPMPPMTLDALFLVSQPLPSLCQWCPEASFSLLKNFPILSLPLSLCQMWVIMVDSSYSKPWINSLYLLIFGWSLCTHDWHNVHFPFDAWNYVDLF